MSDTAIAIVILPFLIALTVALECTRVGCSKVARHIRTARALPQASRSQRTGS